MLMKMLTEQHRKDVRCVTDSRMISELCRKKQGGGKYVERIEQAMESGWAHDDWLVVHTVRQALHNVSGSAAKDKYKVRLTLPGMRWLVVLPDKWKVLRCSEVLVFTDLSSKEVHWWADCI